jgi:hypothetical protein
MKNESMTGEEFEAMLCGRCARIWNIGQVIADHQLCGECRVTFEMNRPENKSWFKGVGVDTLR